MFGRVLEGVGAIQRVEQAGTRSGQMQVRCEIVDCGELPGRDRGASGAEALTAGQEPAAGPVSKAEAAPAPVFGSEVEDVGRT